MKLGDSIRRVKETETKLLLKLGWNYCSKHEWKEKLGIIKKDEKEIIIKKKH
jgi:hypothetical protein